MDVRLPDHSDTNPPLRRGDAVASVLRDHRANGLVAAPQETGAGSDRAREAGEGEAAVHGGQL